MKRFSVNCLGMFLACAVMLLQGCSSIGKTYMEINPEDAVHQMKQANGYYALQKFKNENDGTRSLVIFRAPSDYGARYSICAGEKCLSKEYSRIGSTRDFKEGYVLPWVTKTLKAATLFSVESFLEKQVDPGIFLGVKALGGEWDGNLRRSSSCGPVHTGFVPQAGRAYVVQFQLENRRCYVSVYDATDPDNLVKLP